MFKPTSLIASMKPTINLSAFRSRRNHTTAFHLSRRLHSNRRGDPLSQEQPKLHDLVSKGFLWVTHFSSCFTDYSDVRQRLLTKLTAVIRGLMRSGKQKDILIARDLEHWISQEYLKYHDLCCAYLLYQTMRTAKFNEPSNLQRRLKLHRLYAAGPFQDAVSSCTRIVTFIDHHSVKNPQSYILKALESAYPSKEKVFGGLKTSSILKRSHQALSKDSQIIGDWYIAQHGNIFMKEYQFWEILLITSLGYMAKIRRKLTEWNNYSIMLRKHNPTFSSSIPPRYVQSEALHDFISATHRFYIAKDNLKAAMQPYLNCLGERLSFYEKMSEKHPEDISIMKKYMICSFTQKLLGRSKIEKIYSTITYQEKALKRIKAKLLQLRKYLAQVDNPKIAPHQRASLDSFLLDKDAKRKQRGKSAKSRSHREDSEGPRYRRVKLSAPPTA